MSVNITQPGGITIETDPTALKLVGGTLTGGLTIQANGTIAFANINPDIDYPSITIQDSGGNWMQYSSSGITFPDGTTLSTAGSGGSFNGGTITTPLTVSDVAGGSLVELKFNQQYIEFLGMYVTRSGIYCQDTLVNTGYFEFGTFSDVDVGWKISHPIYFQDGSSISSTAGFISDAPFDSYIYGRQNNQWTQIPIVNNDSRIADSLMDNCQGTEFGVLFFNDWNITLTSINWNAFSVVESNTGNVWGFEYFDYANKQVYTTAASSSLSISYPFRFSYNSSYSYETPYTP